MVIKVNKLNLLDSSTGGLTFLIALIVVIILMVSTTPTSGLSIKSIEIDDGSVPTALTWWESSWSKKVPLTINSSLIDSTLTDFPILVKLNSSRINYSLTQDNGEDLRFTDSAESAQLDHEIELWNESGDSYVWVEIPSVASGSDTTFYMYYNNSGAIDGQNITGTWNETFKAVYHLGENLHANDSTLVNNGTINGSTYTRNQNIDGGYLFDAVDDNIIISDDSSMDFTRMFTMSAWVKINDVDTTKTILTKGCYGVKGGYAISTTSSGSFSKDAIFVQLENGAEHYNYTVTDTVITPETWTHITVTFNNSSATGLKIYFNGTEQTYSHQDDVREIRTLATPFNSVIGSSINDSLEFNGTLDEIRLSNISRNAGWIKAEYNSETDNLITYGAEDSFFPQISFESPTPDNNTNTSDANTTINISATGPNLKNFIWNWNATESILFSDNLVLMMNFDNVSALGENDTLAVDVSNSGNNGTVNGSTWTSSGKWNGAYYFDGSNDYINCGDITQLNGVSAFTMSAWLNQDLIDQSDLILHKYINETHQIQIYTHTTGALIFKVCNGAHTYASVYDYSLYMPVNTWHHAVFVFDGSESGNDRLKIYIDGSSTSLNYTGSMPATVANLSGIDSNIGHSTSATWNGTIDEVRIYDRALSSAEIEQLYYSNLRKIDSDSWEFIANRTNLQEGMNNSYIATINNTDATNTTGTRFLRVLPDSNVYVWNSTGETSWTNSSNWNDGRCSYPNDNSDSVTFNSSSTIDCDIDVAVIVGNISIASGYTGTITQSANLSINDTMIIEDGVFDCNYNNLSVEEKLNISSGYLNGRGGCHSFGSVYIGSSGTYNATSEITVILGSLSDLANFSNSGTLTENSGTFNLTSVNVTFDWITSGTGTKINLTDNSEFGALTISSGDTLNMNGNTGKFRGALDIDGTFECENAKLNITGGSSQLSHNLNMAWLEVGSEATLNISSLTLNLSKMSKGTSNFTIVALPDTQAYSKFYPDIFTNQTQWAVNNKDLLNIAFVTHEGDIVQNWDNDGQWEAANTSMSILDGYIPYGIIPGNHDLGSPDEANPDFSYFNNYFNYTRYENETWYGGHYPSDGNDNNYQLFSAGGMDFVILHLRYNSSGSELTWADSVLKNYSDRRAIVTTHYIIMPNATRPPMGDTIFNALKNNTNLFLILGGHYGPVGDRVDVVNGHRIYQIVADWQHYTNGGNGWLRIMEFVPSENKICVKTYSPYLNQYNTSDENNFNISYDMGDDSLVVNGTLNVINDSIVDVRNSIVYGILNSSDGGLQSFYSLTIENGGTYIAPSSGTTITSGNFTNFGNIIHNRGFYNFTSGTEQYIFNLSVNSTEINATLVNVTILNLESQPPDKLGYVSINKYINATNFSSGWMNVSIPYSASDHSNLINESNIQFWKYNSTDWTQTGISSQSIDTDANIITANITSFSIIAPLGESIFPRWSDNQSSIPSNYTGSASEFNITWSGANNISPVYWESNITGTPDNYTMSNSTYGGEIYNYSVVLPVGTYYWKSYANDSSDNWNASDQWNFTIGGAVSNEESSSSSGGGGGGGGSTVASTSTYSVYTKAELDQGYSKDIESGDKLRINISLVYYYVTADEISDTSVKMNITGGYDQIIFNIGDSKNFDVDGDGVYDITVTVNSINTTAYEANVKVQTYTVPPETPGEATEETEEAKVEETEETMPEETGGFPTWATLAIVAVILAVGYFWFIHEKGIKTKK